MVCDWCVVGLIFNFEIIILKYLHFPKKSISCGKLKKKYERQIDFFEC